MARKRQDRIKRLSLESWMLDDEALDECLHRYPPVTARIGRPGYYRAGTDCWFELPDGRAFSAKPADFDYLLGITCAAELTAKDAAALAAIARTRYATPRQRKLSYLRRCAIESRNLCRDTRKFMIHCLRESDSQP